MSATAISARLDKTPNVATSLTGTALIVRLADGSFASAASTLPAWVSVSATELPLEKLMDPIAAACCSSTELPPLTRSSCTLLAVSLTVM